MKHSSINFRSISVQPAWLLSSLRTGFHKDTTAARSLTTLTTLRSDGVARPAGQQREAELVHLDLTFCCPVQAFLFFLLCWDQYMLEFDLRALASITRTYDERGFQVDERGRKLKKKNTERRKVKISQGPSRRFGRRGDP